MTRPTIVTILAILFQTACGEESGRLPEATGFPLSCPEAGMHKSKDGFLAPDGVEKSNADKNFHLAYFDNGAKKSLLVMVGKGPASQAAKGWEFATRAKASAASGGDWRVDEWVRVEVDAIPRYVFSGEGLDREWNFLCTPRRDPVGGVLLDGSCSLSAREGEFYFYTFVRPEYWSSAKTNLLNAHKIFFQCFKDTESIEVK